MGAVLNRMHELSCVALAENAQPPAVRGDLQISRGKCADENDLLAVLAYVDETTCAGQSGTEATDIQVALALRLRQAQERNVEPTTIVEVELVGLIDDCLGVDRGSEIEPPAGMPPMTAGSAVNVIRSTIFSSQATLAMPSCSIPLPFDDTR